MSRRKSVDQESFVEETAVETEVVNKEREVVEAVIYCGASLASGTLQQYSVFNNGIPQHLNEHIEKCPAIKGLMVPIARLPEVRKGIEEQGTAEHTLNELILAYVRSGN